MEKRPITLFLVILTVLTIIRIHEYVTETVFIFTLAVMEAILSKSNAYGFQVNNFLKELDNQQFGTSFRGHLQTTEVQTPTQVPGASVC